ncbi:MAG TPA: hypothetical protein VF529_11635 [Solirubrobacteraceae bacterium]
MRKRKQRDPTKASRLEILGAWLHVWTPPRDVRIPPVPWSKVAVGAGVLVAIGVFTALVIAPAIDEAKDEGAAERQAAEDRRAAARRARIRAEQQPRSGPLPRTAALRAVERRIAADAHDRFGAPEAAPTACELAPGEGREGGERDETGELGAAGDGGRLVYDCLVPVREIRGAGKQEGARGSLAIPYRAVLDFDERRYAFCKANPRPGEAALAKPEDVVDLPAACRR